MPVWTELRLRYIYYIFAGMAGSHGGVDESQFKGWQKHFNTYTVRGRSNVRC